jgi:hypothetical protein
MAMTLLSLGLAACGYVQTTPDGVGGMVAAGGASGGNSAGAQGGSSSDPGLPAPTTRFARLTHLQWENSVRDLLHLSAPSGHSATFPSDALGASFVFDNVGEALTIDQALIGAYSRAAAALAQQVISDNALLERVLPASSAEPAARARAFIVEFGARAFRRPLTDDEVDRYMQLYAQGAALDPDASPLLAGVGLLIDAFLQSPNFLYRVEMSSAVSDEGIALSSWEVAQRLSYFITNSMPDTELFEAARAGQLDAGGVQAQVERLLSLPSARPALQHFHEQLFDLEDYAELSPSPEVYPDVPGEFGASVLGAAQAFLTDLAFEERGGYADLMTSTSAFANADLASVYGLEGTFGSELVKVNLNAAERGGFLNQIGYLAANANSTNGDPIHRGVFLVKRLLCRLISAPPDNVVPPPPIAQATNRATVENHTESTDGCRACHSTLINPYGFPFEHYDAVGAYRALDNGVVVDATSTPVLDGDIINISNSLELSAALATSREAHQCFVTHLLEYALGRNSLQEDGAFIDTLDQASEAGASILDLVGRIATSPAFARRNPQELP